MATEFKRRTATDDPPAEADIHQLETSFARRVLRGLAVEWDHASWLLPDALQRSMRKPLFAIRDMPTRLGCWNRDKREITVSRDLVAGCRWDDVKEVLLHEMAHQVAQEGLQATSEPDHGPSFKKACCLLRANPAASGTYPPLSARMRQGEAMGDQDRIVIRIHKLMALAQSSNPNEAHAAMAKAHDLIARYNVDLIDRGVNQDYHSLFLGLPRLRHFRESYHLAHLLQSFYFVQCMWIPAWVLEKNRMGRVLEVSGTRKNILLADYIHDTIHHYIDESWAAYRQGKHLNRYRKTDFAIGIIEGFATTLRQASIPSADRAGDRLPVHVDDHALMRYMARRYPHVRSFSRKGLGCDRKVLRAGTRRGRKLIIAKGITLRDDFKGQMLGYHDKK